MDLGEIRSDCTSISTTCVGCRRLIKNAPWDGARGTIVQYKEMRRGLDPFSTKVQLKMRRGLGPLITTVPFIMRRGLGPLITTVPVLMRRGLGPLIITVSFNTAEMRTV